MEKWTTSRPKRMTPAWMATFADLAILLMCFFILLLSFSEMDTSKFKRIAGSMQEAFGVQNQMEIKDIPKGTSVIAKEFRPGRPEPTPLNVIMQQTTDMTQQSLDFKEGETVYAGGVVSDIGRLVGGDKPDKEMEKESMPTQMLPMLYEDLQKVLNTEIQDEQIELEYLGQQLVIRIQETGAFPKDSAFLQPQFQPVIQDIANRVKDIPGKIVVTGHADIEPFESQLYRSKWDISAQRAVSVVQEMEKVLGADAQRLQVMGMADTKPKYLEPTEAERQWNRRVEIEIWQGEPHYRDTVSVTSKSK